ncbi:MAG: hypothetical protein QG603_359 [Patescibacteria group bacterium]|nr:hypothetical protein [Patescibacteria group bacterium]
MNPKISVIIVNWRVRKLLEECLRSIYRQADAEEVEVIVVDNDSQDSTSEMLMVQFPQVKSIALAKNKGFAYANNLGIKIASGQLIMLLNPDTVLNDNFFTQVFEYMASNPNAAIVGPLILNNDSSVQASVRRFPGWRSQMLILLKMKNIMPQQKWLANYLIPNFDYQAIAEVDQIMGAAMIIRRSTFDKIGLLDSKYFIWFEEVDFCQRAKKHGLSIKFVPNFSLKHYGGASFEQAPTVAKQLMFNRSMMRYFSKHQPVWQVIILAVVLPVNLLLTALYGLYLRARAE